MINTILWILTDTDFSDEWNQSSLIEKIELIYTTAGFLCCWLINLLLLSDMII